MNVLDTVTIILAFIKNNLNPSLNLAEFVAKGCDEGVLYDRHIDGRRLAKVLGFNITKELSQISLGGILMLIYTEGNRIYAIDFYETDSEETGANLLLNLL